MTKVRNPFPIISRRPDDDPKICIEINRSWLPALLGMVQPFRYPEYWLGTLAENKQARADVLKLLDILSEAGECDMTNNCCVNVTVILHRIDPITLQLQISIDGGATWTPDPESELNTAIQQPPLVTVGGGDKCDAASNGKQHIEDIIAGSSENLGTAQTVLDLAIGVASIALGVMIFFILGPEVAPITVEIITTAAGIIWGAAKAALELGKTGFDSYWTTDERDKILCALYCTIGEDGAFTDSQFAQFISKWKSLRTPSLAFDLVEKTVYVGGAIGLTNMCSYGDGAISDCNDCDCSGCDFSGWEQWVNGTILEQDADHIVIEAVFGGGQWNAGVRNPNINTCCCFVVFTPEQGQNISTVGYVPCAATNDDQSHMLFAYTNQSANAFAMADLNPFTVTITGQECA